MQKNLTALEQDLIEKNAEVRLTQYSHGAG